MLVPTLALRCHYSSWKQQLTKDASSSHQSNEKKLRYFQSTMFTEFLPGATVLDKIIYLMKAKCKPFFLTWQKWRRSKQKEPSKLVVTACVTPTSKPAKVVKWRAWVLQMAHLQDARLQCFMRRALYVEPIVTCSRYHHKMHFQDSRKRAHLAAKSASSIGLVISWRCSSSLSYVIMQPMMLTFSRWSSELLVALKSTTGLFEDTL